MDHIDRRDLEFMLRDHPDLRQEGFAIFEHHCHAPSREAQFKFVEDFIANKVNERKQFVRDTERYQRDSQLGNSLQSSMSRMA